MIELQVTGDHELRQLFIELMQYLLTHFPK